MNESSEPPIVLVRELHRGLPDPGDLGLAAVCGGDPRGTAAAAAGSMLRVLASFPPKSVRLGIYLEFDPARPREKRTRVLLAGRCRDANDRATLEALRLLMARGPLQGVHGVAFQAGRGPDEPVEVADEAQKRWIAMDAYRVCHRILRREEVQPVRDETAASNHRLLGRHLRYYAVHPFKPREGNDWLGLDRLLDRLTHPALIELIAGPHDASALAAAQFHYRHELTQINAYESPLDRVFVEDKRRTVLAALQQDPQADHFSKLHEELAETLRQPQLLFALRCWSACPQEGRLLAAIVAEECFDEGSYQIRQIDHFEKRRARAPDMVVVPPVREPIMSPNVGSDPVFQDGLARLCELPMVCPPDQLASALRLPMARGGSAPRTMGLHTDPPPAKTGTYTDGLAGQETSLLVGEDLEVGPATLGAGELAGANSLDPFFGDPSGKRAEIRLERALLQKHLFVCGVPGSGKTTAMFNLVAQLHYQSCAHAPSDAGTPFLIIEPAKTEYRVFKRFRDHPDERIRRLANNLQVYTIGDDRVSPFRFNPMIRGEGVTREEHIGALMACFKASMPIDGPLEGILQEALVGVFDRYEGGGDRYEGGEAGDARPAPERPPRLSDLVKEAQEILGNKSYDSEITGNIRAALEVRLGLLTKGSLGRVLECDDCVPSRDELFSRPVVLEMDLLTQPNACLMTLLVLTALRQHLRATSHSGSPLRHVVFLEEAHNIVGRTGEGDGEADPRKHAADFIARMLAEVRALGQGMIIADQLPSAVAPEVIKNTGSKLALRLVANDDREELGGTMLLDENGIAELARLSGGTGFFYREGYYRPRRVQTLFSEPLLRATRAGAPAAFEPPDGPQLRALLVEDAWFNHGEVERDQLDVMDFIRGHCKRHLQGASAELKAALDRLNAGRQSWIDNSEEGRDSYESHLRDTIRWRRNALAEVERFAGDFLYPLATHSRIDRSVDRFIDLLNVINRSLVNHIFPLLGYAALAQMQISLAAELLNFEEDGEETADDDSDPHAAAIALLPPYHLESLETEPAPGCLSQLTRMRAVMVSDAAKRFDDFEKYFKEWPSVSGPEGIPEDATPDDYVAHYHQCRRQRAEAIQYYDQVCADVAVLVIARCLIDPTVNPLLAVAGQDEGEASDLRKKILRMATRGVGAAFEIQETSRVFTERIRLIEEQSA